MNFQSKMKRLLFLLIVFCFFQNRGFGQSPEIQKGQLIYENTMRSAEAVGDWVMEGPGKVEFQNGWMEMYSPQEEFHHVFWCPEDFPGSFVAEWEAQNLNTEAGLCILFFAAKGKNGEDLFDSSFPLRDGTFSQYTKSEDFNTYHISYYANGRDNPGREVSHLRKNSGFHLVQQEEPGIPVASKEIHKLKLVKDDSRIIMYVDGRKIIDWTDKNDYGPVLQGGKIGFRQMQWTHFRYKNFKVWELGK
ncbi:LuxR family transcriptional regulator [Cyclobacterium amurskyense]|uniref:LuxR family transcriptional regulator n=2 Tax=Cyclobacterium amurskyense TaxID=320787 RepID=A0A0H4P9X6_9BACT|nr:LuxR family transcriptional regulator [Cyclobacterium amurskyense]